MELGLFSTWNQETNWGHVFNFILLRFLERKGGESKREREIDVQEKPQSVASLTYPDQGLNLHPGCVP